MPAEKTGIGNSQETDEQLPNQHRRNFLKLAVSLSTLVSIAGIGAVIKSVMNPTVATTTLSQFPRVKIAQLSDLEVNQPIVFAYPLDNEPNILVKLGQKADGGIGPEGDIVAFSALCQHLGCVFGFQPTGTSPKCDSSYKSPGPVGYCCCHGSAYDLLHNAKVISGPSPRQQPQVILEIDEQSNIFAKGMGPPTIFGHNTGSSDVTADLEGGNPVG
jgi:arsenite oxidase small subunit